MIRGLTTTTFETPSDASSNPLSNLKSTFKKLTSLSASKAMETDNKEDAKPKTRKVKKQVRKGELPIVSGTSSLDVTTKNAWTEKEATMVMEDKLVADTEEKKNELETYIYDLRNKLDEQYAEFASEEEKDKIRAKLTDSEVSSPCRNPTALIYPQP